MPFLYLPQLPKDIGIPWSPVHLFHWAFLNLMVKNFVATYKPASAIPLVM